MSRTTGFPATIVARMLASGRIARPGVHPPEVLGQIEGVTEAVLDELRDRGVHFVHTHT
jgi:saccharopine dehydrogenase-like NADP-dependent oxidoreductase